MINVVRTFFLNKEEATNINLAIDYTMPQYEIEDGRTLYAHITGADIMTYHSYDTLENIIAYKKMLEDAWYLSMSSSRKTDT